MAGNSEDGLGGTWGGRGFFLDSSPKLTIVLPPPPRPPTQSTAEVEAEIAREIMYEEIHRVSNICSNENLKSCRDSIIKQLSASPAKKATILAFLVNLSLSFIPRDPSVIVDTTTRDPKYEGLGEDYNTGGIKQPPQPAFKRLHVLYLFSDIWIHLRTHQQVNDEEDFRHVGSCLAQLAACDCTGKAAKTGPLVFQVLEEWKERQLFSNKQIKVLRHSVIHAEKSDFTTITTKIMTDNKEREKEKENEAQRWTLPMRHGKPHEPNAPWHELPAANGLYMRRKYGYPLQAKALPNGGYALARGGQEADEDLKKDVTNLVSDMKRCFSKRTNAEEVQDIDAMGNIIWKDPERKTRNYWGFSVDGVERKKEIERQAKENAEGYEMFHDAMVSDARERVRAMARGGGEGGRGGFRGGYRGAGRGRFH